MQAALSAGAKPIGSLRFAPYNPYAPLIVGKSTNGTAVIRNVTTPSRTFSRDWASFPQRWCLEVDPIRNRSNPGEYTSLRSDPLLAYFQEAPELCTDLSPLPFPLWQVRTTKGISTDYRYISLQWVWFSWKDPKVPCYQEGACYISHLASSCPLLDFKICKNGFRAFKFCVGFMVPFSAFGTTANLINMNVSSLQSCLALYSIDGYGCSSAPYGSCTEVKPMMYN